VVLFLDDDDKFLEEEDNCGGGEGFGSSCRFSFVDSAISFNFSTNEWHCKKQRHNKAMAILENFFIAIAIFL
jgi:hypothetical protein